MNSWAFLNPGIRKYDRFRDLSDERFVELHEVGNLGGIGASSEWGFPLSAEAVSESVACGRYAKIPW